jgi:hypothetical protein
MWMQKHTFYHEEFLPHSEIINHSEKDNSSWAVFTNTPQFSLLKSLYLFTFASFTCKREVSLVWMEHCKALLMCMKRCLNRWTFVFTTYKSWPPRNRRRLCRTKSLFQFITTLKEAYLKNKQRNTSLASFQSGPSRSTHCASHDFSLAWLGKVFHCESNAWSLLSGQRAIVHVRYLHSKLLNEQACWIFEYGS